MATWKVEKLTDVKICELQRHMTERNIKVLAMQETKRTGAACERTGEGFLLAVSGGETDKEFAGVGFLVAPWCVKCR